MTVPRTVRGARPGGSDVVVLLASTACIYVSRQLGHASPKITLDVYAHLFDGAEHAQRARDRLEEAFGTLLERTDGDTRRDPGESAAAEVVDLQRFSAGGD